MPSVASRGCGLATTAVVTATAATPPTAVQNHHCLSSGGGGAGRGAASAFAAAFCSSARASAARSVGELLLAPGLLVVGEGAGLRDALVEQAARELGVRRVGEHVEVAAEEERGALVVSELPVALPEVEEEPRERTLPVRLAVQTQGLFELAAVVGEPRLLRERAGLGGGGVLGAGERLLDRSGARRPCVLGEQHPREQAGEERERAKASGGAAGPATA